MEPCFQVGIVVQDLEGAIEELTQALNFRWSEPRDVVVRDWPLRIAFSVEGPPHIELVQGPEGSPWDASSGPRLDHLQWWTSDLAGETGRLEAMGMRLESGGPEESGVYSYVRAPKSGLRIELIQGSPEDVLGVPYRERWGIADA